MARRSKAQSRHARQRRRQGAGQRPPAPRPAPLAPSAEEALTELEESSLSPATSTSAATGASVGRSSVPASQRGSRVNPRLTVAGPSRLSERAIEEYHYVTRDLRNIGILVLVMVGILVIAFIAFTALGFGKTA